MFAWGLDEIAEGIGLIYVVIIGLFYVLVKLEHTIDDAPKPRTRVVRQLSRQWVDDVITRADPVIAWLSHARSWDSERFSRKLRITTDDVVRLPASLAIERREPANGAPTVGAKASHDVDRADAVDGSDDV